MHDSEVARSCPTPSDPMDCSLPDSSVHRIFQARVLEWVAIASSVIEKAKGQKTFLLAQSVKNPPANVGDRGSIPWSGRSPGEGNGNPLQYLCLGNPISKRSPWATVHGVARLGYDLVTKPPKDKKGRRIM